MEKMAAKETLERLEAFDKNVKWFEKNRKRLMAQYGEGEVVAISEEKVTAHDKNLTELLKKLRSKGVEAKDLLIESLSDVALILSQRPAL